MKDFDIMKEKGDALMPNNEQTLVRLKVGNLSDIGKDENTNQPTPEVEGGSILFGIYDDATSTPGTTVTKGKILFDLPDGSQRIVMSTDAEFAEKAAVADSAIVASSASALALDNAIDGVIFNGTSGITHYTTCSTAANQAAKTASCDGFTLITGARVIVKYAITNTADNPTLNISNTGARAIYHRGSPINPDYLAAGEVHEYVYDGTYWNYVGTIAENVIITIDDNTKTLFITSPVTNGDGVSY